MSSATPDQKGPADQTPTKAAPASEDVSPGRALNANAKSFVPRLETDDSPTPPAAAAGTPAKQQAPAKAPMGQRANSGSPKQQQQQQTPVHANPAVYAAQQAGVPPQYAAPIAPLTNLAMPGGAAAFNPNLAMMSPMMMAALAASGRGGGAAVPASPFAPPSPLAPTTPMSAHVPVNVGNATLQAMRATGPVKFACVLLVGMPRVGKTTIGRGLIQDLENDGLKWAFFSGGDHLRDTPTRPAPWDTAKDVYDALSRKIDELQAAKAVDEADKVKGLIIDKQCRGTEELYYLTALLKSKGLHLNGVVGLLADDAAKLMDRLHETDNAAFREKCKFHHVTQTRIREASKAAGLWRPVDALEEKDVVVRKVRSMVLGCSSQTPHKQLSPATYSDGIATMVDSYETYANVMSELVRLTRMAKPSQFPGFTMLQPLPQTLLNRRSALKEYAIRRRNDGTKYVLMYDGDNLFLIPRHMRCVFSVRADAWLGVPLGNVAKFVLDGDLVRLSKERSKEKFLVQDVVCWHEKVTPHSNSVLRMAWSERQERLKTFMCGESSAFYSSNYDLVIVHQTFVDSANAAQLLESCDYATDGFVFQPRIKRDDAVYFWRPPENVQVDFRLGAVTALGDGTRRYALQVFDHRDEKSFVEYAGDTVVVQENRQFVVEGALVVCSLRPEEAAKSQSREWTYVRTRTDIPTAAFKSYVDDLLGNCMIPRAAVLQYLNIDPNAPVSAKADGTAAEATGVAGAIPNPSFQARGGFGSALDGPAATAAAADEGASRRGFQTTAPSSPPTVADIVRRAGAATAAAESAAPPASAPSAERTSRAAGEARGERPARKDRAPAPAASGEATGDKAPAAKKGQRGEQRGAARRGEQPAAQKAAAEGGESDKKKGGRGAGRGEKAKDDAKQDAPAKDKDRDSGKRRGERRSAKSDAAGDDAAAEKPAAAKREPRAKGEGRGKKGGADKADGKGKETAAEGGADATPSAEAGAAAAKKPRQNTRRGGKKESSDAAKEGKPAADKKADAAPAPAAAATA